VFRVQIEANGQIAYQMDVSTKAYALFQTRELAHEASGSVLIEHESDLMRYQTQNGCIRALAL
jgi:hypothetical protein